MDDLQHILDRISQLETKLKQHEEEIERLKSSSTTKTFSVTASAAQTQVKINKSLLQETKPITSESLPKKVKSKENLELKIGGTLINRIGIVAIIFALAYFLKYAFDNELIGPTGRIMIGITSGILFLFLGEHLHKKYSAFAQGLTGGGIAFLYFSIFAAFSFYHFINQTTAFALLVLITAAASAISMRYDSRAILLLGVITGFLTPFLLRSDEPHDITFLTYIVILDLGILSVAFFKKWQIINYVSFLATQIVSLLWVADRFIIYDSDKTIIQFWTAEIFVTIFFLTFLSISLLYNIVKRTAVAKLDYALIILNAASYFALNYYLISEKYEWFLGLFAVIMALIYFLVPYIIGKHYKVEKVILAVFLGMALTFITLAIPIQLDGNWVTLSWAVEGAILLYISFIINYPKIRIGSLAVLIMAVIRLFFFDLENIFDMGYTIANKNQTFIPILNLDTIIFIACILSLFAAAYLYGKNTDVLKLRLEKHMVAVIAIGSNILAILLIIANVSAYFDYYKTMNNLSYSKDLNNLKHFIYSAVLILYSLAAIVTGILAKIRYLRLFSFVLFLISIGKVFLVDLSELEKQYRILSFVLLGLILLGVSYMYQRFKYIILGVSQDEDEV